jgi:hypothetical protein
MDNIVTIWLRHNWGYNFIDSGGRAFPDAGLRPLDYTDHGFESRWQQLPAFAKSWSQVQRILTGCVCLCLRVCVWVFDLETVSVGRSISVLGCGGTGKNVNNLKFQICSKFIKYAEKQCSVLKRFGRKPNWLEFKKFHYDRSVYLYT